MDKRLQSIIGFFQKQNRPLLEEFLTKEFGPNKYPVQKGENIVFKYNGSNLVSYRGLTFISSENRGNTLEIYPESANISAVISKKELNTELTEYLKQSLSFVLDVTKVMSKYLLLGIQTDAEITRMRKHLILSHLQDKLSEEYFCFIDNASQLYLSDKGIIITLYDTDDSKTKVTYVPDLSNAKVKVKTDLTKNEPEIIAQEIFITREFKSSLESAVLTSLFRQKPIYSPVRGHYFRRYLALSNVKFEFIKQQLKDQLTYNEIAMLTKSSSAVTSRLKEPPEGAFIEAEEYKEIRKGEHYNYKVIKTFDFACYFEDGGIINVVRKNDEHPFIKL